MFPETFHTDMYSQTGGIAGYSLHCSHGFMVHTWHNYDHIVQLRVLTVVSLYKRFSSNLFLSQFECLSFLNVLLLVYITYSQGAQNCSLSIWQRNKGCRVSKGPLDMFVQLFALVWKLLVFKYFKVSVTWFCITKGKAI